MVSEDAGASANGVVAPDPAIPPGWHDASRTGRHEPGHHKPGHHEPGYHEPGHDDFT